MERPDFRVVIPARFASTRLPGKPLLRVNGVSILQYVYRNAVDSGAAEVIIATDDSRIVEHAREFGADTIMTSDQHVSGTDRIAEVARVRAWNASEVVVNLQGDEPQMDARNIEQVARLLQIDSLAQVATLRWPIQHADDLQNPNIVKVVTDLHGRAMYFSRSTIPHSGSHDQGIPVFRHLGIYAYRVGYLHEFTRVPPGALELAERLEQLRVLENGDKIAIETSLVKPGIGIDVQEDLRRFSNMVGKEG